MLTIDQFIQHPVMQLHKEGDYPLLFIRSLLEKINDHVPVRVIDIKEQSFDELASALHVSFLGMKQWFWFGDVHLYSEKEKQQFLKLIQTYQGPHHIAFFSADKEASLAKHVISIHDCSSEQEFHDLVTRWHGPVSKSLSHAIPYFFKKRKQFTPDQILLLADYGSLSGNLLSTFMDEWFDRLIVSQDSLFTLSSLFFGRQSSFLTTWYSLKQLYPPVFWTTYWSEQLFRASAYIKAQEKKDVKEARSISFKLPFSFINHDWKKISLTELAHLHDSMYQLDCSLKQGGSFMPESLFIQFIEMSV